MNEPLIYFVSGFWLGSFINILICGCFFLRELIHLNGEIDKIEKDLRSVIE